MMPIRNLQRADFRLAGNRLAFARKSQSPGRMTAHPRTFKRRRDFTSGEANPNDSFQNMESGSGNKWLGDKVNPINHKSRSLRSRDDSRASNAFSSSVPGSSNDDSNNTGSNNNNLGSGGRKDGRKGSLNNNSYSSDPDTGSVTPTTTTTAAASPSSDAPMCNTCIADNDPRVLYSGPWTLNFDGFFTTHSTTTAGATISLAFNGSGIVVFGTVPQSNATRPPPSASYSIDAAKPFTTTEPLADKDIPFQPLFSISQLSNKEHTLFVKITSAGAPYTVNSFFIVPQVNSTMTAISKSGPPSESSATPSSSAPAVSPTELSNHHSERSVKVVAGVLSTLIILLLMIIGWHLLRRRRRKLGLPMTFSWKGSEKSHRRGFGENSIFTSTESIFQTIPSSMWSYRTRSEEGGSANKDHFVYHETPPPLPPKPLLYRDSYPLAGGDRPRNLA